MVAQPVQPGADPVAVDDQGGNLYPKYTSANPIARLLVGNFLRCFDELVRAASAGTVHEVGCGEGFLSARLAAQGHAVRGSDRSARAVARAQQQAAAAGASIAFAARDLYQLDPARDAAELIVCCEVLEHLPDPAAALAILRRLARPYLLISVPREPLWRVLNLARGQYWPELGNTPGHLQHWSTGALRRLLAEFVVIDQLRTPLPWTMALCRVG